MPPRGLFRCRDCSKWHDSENSNDTAVNPARWVPRSDPTYCKPDRDFVVSEALDSALLALALPTVNRSVFRVSINELGRGAGVAPHATTGFASPEWAAASLPGDDWVMFVSTHSQDIAQHKNLNRSFVSSNWCAANLPTGMKYVGKYRAVITNYQNGENRRGARFVSNTWHDCAHCAWVEATNYISTHQLVNKYPWLYQGFPELATPSRFESGMVEIVGDRFDTTATIKDVTERIANSCGNCGRVGHRSDGCENPRKAFDRVGVEVEGRFLNLNTVIRHAEDITGGEGYRDGSVHETPDGTGAEAWEFQTKPDSIRGACQQLVDLYPDETDESCGMHVHVSFDAVDMTVLNSTAFFKYFRERWEAWGARMNLHPNSPFFRRLRGHNEYCLPADETREYSVRNMDRYAQLNFGAFGEHRTVECRLLPMFKRASLGVAAIQELLDIYETFLHNPEQYGHAGFSRSALFAPTSTEPVKLAPKELEMHPEIKYTKALEMELTEAPPVPEGHVRVAMAVNQPITIQGLVDTIRARNVAA